MARKVRLWRKCVWLSSRLPATTTKVVVVLTRVTTPSVMSAAAPAPTHSATVHSSPGGFGAQLTYGSQK
jgi:hypothetical protein